MSLYDRALEIARDVGDSRAECNAMFNMSLCFYQAGERERAVACAEKAPEIFLRPEDPNATGVGEYLVRWGIG